MKFDDQLREFELRKTKILQMGGEKKIEKQGALNRLTARERVDYFFDRDTFTEIGMFAHGQEPQDIDSTPADGKICGYGRVNDRPAAVVSHDITVKGASSSRINVQKMSHMRRSAIANGFPLVLFNESTGARMPETMGAVGIGSLGRDPEQFLRHREINYISAVLGPSFGTAAWFTQISDFVVMRRDAYLAVASPKVTSVATSDETDLDALGGAQLQATITGKADLIVDTDQEAIDSIKKFLSYMPSHSGERPPIITDWTKSNGSQDEILDILPAERNKVYDMRKICGVIADDRSIFPLKSQFAAEAFTALGRIEGSVVGFIASNPRFKAGALGPDACDKICSFIVLCDSFNIPIIFMMDTPGFAVGVLGEQKKAPGKIMNFMAAVQLCTVPKFTLAIRKGYGQAFMNFGGTRNADEIAAWFTADVGFMDPQVGANVVYGRDKLQDSTRAKDLIASVKRGTSAYDLAGIFGAHIVIDPRESRNWLSRMLKVHERNRDQGVGQHLMRSWPTTL